MKLVEILAKELGEWPEGYGYIAQDGKRLEFQIAAYKTAPVYVSGEWQAAGNLECGDYLYPTECTDPATDHATAIVTREMWQAERDEHSCERVEEVAADILSRTAKDSGYICWMRDRIREIDATVEAMTAERAELVSKLAGEGFALIAAAAEPVEDMSDWRNWKVGDCVEVVDDGEWMNPVGAVISITEIDSGDESNYPITAGNIYYMPKMLKFHSRPSA